MAPTCINSPLENARRRKLVQLLRSLANGDYRAMDGNISVANTL